MLEIDTALCIKKLNSLPDVGVPLPSNIFPGISTTLAYDNIDRLEETLSGSDTSHRINAIIIQRTAQGPILLPVHEVMQKTKQRSLKDFVEDLHVVPKYNAGE